MVGVSLVLGLLIGCANIVYWSKSTIVTQHSGFNYGEIIWLIVMPVWFLVIGGAEAIGADPGRSTLERAPPGIQRAVLKALVGTVAFGLLLPVVWILLQSQEAASRNHVLLNIVWAGVPMAMLLAAMGRDRSIIFNIKTVETLGWSPAIAWRGVLLGMLGGLAVGSFIYLPGLGFDEIASDKRVFCLCFGAVGAALGALLGGLEPRVFKGKTGPNQGIRFSLRMAVLMGLNAVWIVAMVWAFLEAGKFIAGTGPLATLGYFALTFTGLFCWFGGIDVLKHYVLRAVLAASGQVPWNLSRLLDHARDLNLMQKVGNGYIFTHLRLLEYLIAPEREGSQPGAR